MYSDLIHTLEERIPMIVMLSFRLPADKSEPKANTANQEGSQILQDMSDDVYQQYSSLTRQGSDFDSQTGFGINVSSSAGNGALVVSASTTSRMGACSYVCFFKLCRFKLLKYIWVIYQIWVFTLSSVAVK